MSLIRVVFQPTLPVRGVTGLAWTIGAMDIFQPTLPVRGVTQVPERQSNVHRISTHTPRAGSDLTVNARAYAVIFQPTLPVRGVTSLLVRFWTILVFQPTLPVRGVTP